MLDLFCGDCRDVLKTLPAASVDAVVTDPPYHLTALSRGGSPRSIDLNTPYGRTRLGGDRGFMGQTWDGGDTAFRVETWVELLRVLKPGGHLVAFGGGRTYHRMACAIEDAGFEIRDQLQWLYGTGFPKSLNVSKAIDKAAGTLAERSLIRERYTVPRLGAGATQDVPYTATDTAPVTDAARQWDGWGTGLKPAHEPIALARKPLSERSVILQVQATGTGALNIDACRIGGGGGCRSDSAYSGGPSVSSVSCYGRGLNDQQSPPVPGLGRWPANVLLDGDAGEALDAQSGDRPGMSQGTLRRGGTTGKGIGYHGGSGMQEVKTGYDDAGGASRFFFRAENDPPGRWPANVLIDEAAAETLDAQSGELARGHHPAQRRGRSMWADGGGGLNGNAGSDEYTDAGGASRFFYCAKASGAERSAGGAVINGHPTVKPIAVMAWLCRLICPPGGVILDPFVGSGSTAIAARRYGFGFIGIELSADYLQIARNRLAAFGVLP